MKDGITLTKEYDEEHAECLAYNNGDYGIILHEWGEEREIILHEDEMMRLVAFHPAVKRLVEWASSIAGATNTKLEYPADWARGREVLEPFETLDEKEK